MLNVHIFVAHFRFPSLTSQLTAIIPFEWLWKPRISLPFLYSALNNLICHTLQPSNFGCNLLGMLTRTQSLIEDQRGCKWNRKQAKLISQVTYDRFKANQASNQRKRNFQKEELYMLISLKSKRLGNFLK